MDLLWKNVESLEKPKDTDITSSPTTVYLHRNITTEINEDGATVYHYEEATITTDEYLLYSLDQNKQDIIALQEGIADLYEALIEVTSGGSDE